MPRLILLNSWENPEERYTKKVNGKELVSSEYDYYVESVKSSSLGTEKHWVLELNLQLRYALQTG